MTAPAGEITLVMENPSSEVHNILARGGNGVDEKGALVGQGEPSRCSGACTSRTCRYSSS
jgi:hypothetical protein